MNRILLIILLALSVVFPVFSMGSGETTTEFFDVLPALGITDSTGVSAAQSVNENPLIEQSLKGSAIIDRDMASLTRLYKYLEQNTLWDIDYQAVYDNMAKAMFDTLGDKYTYYVKSEDSDDYVESVSGKYGGLGFYFSKTYPEYQDPSDEKTLYCVLSQVFANTPADRAGLLSGDLIIAIDGEDTKDLSSNQCAARMKGNVGEEVTVTIKRRNAVFDLTMRREVISVPQYTSTMINDHLGYLQIVQFYSDTNRQILRELQTMTANGIEKLIIDLRNCPGGDVDATLSIADMFISARKLLTINYKDSSKTVEKWANKTTLIDPSVQVVILINEGSASSAEIFSSTMRDNGRAVLVGQTTYGKGIMQAITMWGNADTSVTVASFIPPSGNPIHEVGVQPDYPVDPAVITEDNLEAYTQLMNSEQIIRYVDANPTYSAENVRRFTKTHRNTGLSDEIVNLLVRNEYYNRMTATERPVVDTDFDSDVLMALYVLGEI